VKTAVGEYCQPKCNKISDPQPVKTLLQWDCRLDQHHLGQWCMTETKGVHEQTPSVGHQIQPSLESTCCICSGQTEYGGPNTTQIIEVRCRRDHRRSPNDAAEIFDRLNQKQQTNKVGLTLPDLHCQHQSECHNGTNNTIIIMRKIKGFKVRVFIQILSSL